MLGTLADDLRCPVQPPSLVHAHRLWYSTVRVRVRGWEALAEFWYGTSRPNYWLGFSTSRLQKRED